MHPHRPSLFVKASFLWLLFWVVQSHAVTCFFPDGSAAASMTPCPNSKSCCGKDEACLSNGLCFGADLGVVYRGSCADKSWPIAECPRACYTEIQDNYANLFQCPGNGNWGNMTCSSRGDAETACGEDAMGSWTYISGGNVTTARNGESSNSTCDTSTFTGSNNATESTAATEATTTCADSAPSHPSKVALGAGLGAGLGIPLLISMALLIYFGTSRQRLLAGSQLRLDQQTNGQQTRPSELNGGSNVAELGDKMGMRSELQAS